RTRGDVRERGYDSGHVWSECTIVYVTLTTLSTPTGGTERPSTPYAPTRVTGHTLSRGPERPGSSLGAWDDPAGALAFRGRSLFPGRTGRGRSVVRRRTGQHPEVVVQDG